MRQIKSTIMTIAVHDAAESPVFGECSTHVCIEDEAGGPFIVLRQLHEEAKTGEVALSFEELEAVITAIRTLRAQFLESDQ